MPRISNFTYILFFFDIYTCLYVYYCIFLTLHTYVFGWGDIMSLSLCEDIGKAYEEQTLWRKNTFSPPSGHAGTEFVKEHTRLLRAYKTGPRWSALHCKLSWSFWQAVMVMPSLLLQRPHVKAGSKEFSQHLTRRLSLWKAGKIKELLEEARTIQSRLPKLDMERGTTTSKLNRRFAALISKGEVHAAISLITEHGKGEVEGSTRSHSRGTGYTEDKEPPSKTC